jgi:NAD(P)-dependent dehydrogenase (short-subunit alcohol dehydrogenase family)
MTPALNALHYLKGKVALVTGASTSIGRGVAPRLSEADASVAVNYRGGPEDAETVVAGLLIGTLGATTDTPHPTCNIALVPQKVKESRKTSVRTRLRRKRPVSD